MANRPANHANAFSNVGSGGHAGKAAKEDARKKEREALRKALFEGDEYAVEDQVEVDDFTSHLGPLGVAIQRFQVYFFSFVPFGKDMKMIKARYGTGVAAYFSFMRWTMQQVGGENGLFT